MRDKKRYKGFTYANYRRRCIRKGTQYELHIKSCQKNFTFESGYIIESETT